MKKKSLLIVAILTFVLSFAFAACGGTETPHVHEYGAYTLVEGSMPTETEAGKATATCSCGETTTVDVPKLTDSTVWTLTTTDATCTADGKKEYTSVYGKVDVTIPAAHKLGTLVAATESTCKTQGNVAYYECEVCGKYFAEDGTTELTAEQILKALAEHAYGTLHEATEPTCFSEGNVAYYECAVCNKYFDADRNEITSYVIEKTQHNFGEWQKGDENGHTRACKTEGCTETEVVPHDYTGQSYYPSGAEEHYVNCKICRYEHRERHEFGEWTKKDETNHAHKCAKCNKEITEAHTGGTATCKEKAVCTVCHEAYGDFAAHVLGVDGVCTVCGKMPNAVFGKTYSAFTVSATGSVSTKVNALLTFDANGKAEGVTGSVGIIKKNGEFEEEGWYDTEYYKITDSSVYIRYVDKEKGTIQFVSSYMKATKSSAYGKYGTPKLTETTYDGYITATNGFIFIPQWNGDHIVLVPTDTPVTTDLISAVAFSSKGNMYGRLFIKYTGTEAHTVYYDGAYGGGREVVTSIDATVTDFDGAEVAPAAIKTAPAMIVKDKSGNVIAKYGYNGTEVIALDEWAGKYEGELGTVTVWGNGKITLPAGVEGVYTAVADKAYNIEVRVYNSDNDVVAYYEVTADNTAYTYTAEQPEVTVTYDLGDYGTGSEVPSFKGMTYTLAAAPTPTSDAVIFKGWVVGGDEETVYAAGAKIVLTGNTTVTAVWASKTKINIVNEKGENQTIYAGSEDILSEVLKAYIPTATGEEFNYWAIGGVAIDNESIVGATELTVTAVWKKKYTITVVYGNGLANGTETYFENVTPDLTKPGYTDGKVFDGWYTDAAFTTAYTPEALSGDTLEFTVYAKWINAAVPFVGESKGFYISYKASTWDQITGIYANRYMTVNAEGVVVDAYDSIKNKQFTYDSATNQISFDGNIGIYDANENMFVYYKYDSQNRRTSFYMYFFGATEVAKTSVSNDGYSYNYGESVFFRVVVTKNGEAKTYAIYACKDTFYFDVVVEKSKDKGATFTECDSFNSLAFPDVIKVYNADKSTLIATLKQANYTLKVVDEFAGTYTATVDGAGSEDNVVLDGVGNVTFGSLTGTYALNAEKTAYDVYLNSKKVYYSMTVDFEAKTATLVKEMVTISFDLNTVSGVDMGTFASVSVNKNVELETSAYVPTKEGYKFKYWYKTYTDGTLSDKANYLTPTENITLYAEWVVAYTVTFETEHGDTPESLAVEDGDSLVKADFPTLTDEAGDYTFKGWYVKGDTEKTIVSGSSYTVNANVTFVAKWVANVTITIVSGIEGLDNKVVKVCPGDTFDLSVLGFGYYKTDAMEKGKIVSGYYTDAACTDGNEFTATSVTEATTVYAKWVESEPYAIVMAYYSEAGKGKDKTDKNDSSKWYAFEYDITNGCWKSTNQGQGSTMSSMKIVAYDTLTITFQYSCGGETNWDMLYIGVTKNGAEIKKIANESNSSTAPTKKDAGTITLNPGECLEFVYTKDGSGDKGDDTGKIYDLAINGQEITELA